MPAMLIVADALTHPRRVPAATSMRKSATELATYTVASAAALAVDVAVLTILVSRAGWQYLPSAAVSFTAGAVFLYVLSIKVVFRVRRVSNPILELPFFVGLGLVGLVVNTAVMYVVVEALHLHYLIAKAIAAGCTFLTNFVLRRNLLFSRAAPDPS
jgi:putative flippase GtrA